MKLLSIRIERRNNNKNTEAPYHLITCFDFVVMLMFMHQIIFKVKLLPEKPLEENTVTVMENNTRHPIIDDKI